MKNILFINHKQKQCGVYQYGYRSAMILKRSKKYNFMYFEVDDEISFSQAVKAGYPSAILYNYHPSTMYWLNKGVISKYKSIKHYGIHHEGNNTMSVGFDAYINTDCFFIDIKNMFSVPRPLLENHFAEIIRPDIPTIGSFGFGFSNKGFERLVKLVNEQFDTAHINLNIPFAYYGDMYGNIAKGIANSCKYYMTNKNITLNISHDFLDDTQLLDYLSCNSINAFLYDEMPGRGLSSVIDYAISVNVPIAITNTYMFRHISGISPSICIEKRSLKEIVSSGSEILQPYREWWSNANLINKYESILHKTL